MLSRRRTALLHAVTSPRACPHGSKHWVPVLTTIRFDVIKRIEPALLGQIDVGLDGLTRGFAVGASGGGVGSGE